MDNERMDGLSMDIEAAEQDKLRSLFPQCFTDGKLDITKLLAVCGEFETIDENDRERYEFRWKGKQEALQLAGKRSAGTLRPCPEESVDWENTGNLYIEGDNLEVLKLMQTAYYRKVKLIYLDVPYNTGNDFVYEDDFADPLARYKEVTKQTTKSNPEAMGRFHTNWLNMMYPRLRLAANLLRDDGIIFVSIDDGEVHNLRKLCDEVFGEENFIAQFIWRSRQLKDNRNISGVSIDHEYVICYTKQYGQRAFRGTDRKTEQYTNPDNDPRGDWTSANMVGLATADARPNLHYDLINPHTNINYGCPAKGWRYDTKTMQRLISEERIIWPATVDGRPRRKTFLNELSDNLPGFSSIIADGVYTNTATKELLGLFDVHVFDFPKPSELLKEIISQTTENDDIILDFFSGSATTAHAVMQLNAEDGGTRRFIMVQLPELIEEKTEAYQAKFGTICDIGMERIRRAGKKILTDKGDQTALDDAESTPLDIGFKVFKLDSSNLKLWDDSPITGENAVTELEARLLGMLDIIKPDRTNMDVVYEVMLKLGQQLTQPIIPIDLGSGKVVYGVGTGVGSEVKFIVCLCAGITPEDADVMAEYAPGRIVFADACFETSEQKSNVRLTLKDKGIAIKAL